jgi:tight adherence protein C
MLLVLLFATVSASAWFLLAAATRAQAARQASIARVRTWGAPAAIRRSRLPQLSGRPVALTVLLAGVGLLVARSAHASPARGVVVVAAFAGFGALVPRMLARGRVERRAQEIRRALPDALDLLAIGVTAGLSLDAAISRLVETGDGPLVEELRRVLAEVRVGEGRADALARMAERVPGTEIGTLVRSLVQAEHLGVPLAETLRTQADEARRRRGTDAEERAGKAPVKMLLPTAVFIFPALFVVVLAPAILELTRQL